MKKYPSQFVACVLLLTGLALAAAPRAAFPACGDFSAIPPFLSTTSYKPNLLLFIDNSASMYDLAYTSANATYCYDDSYNSSSSYLGYFDNNVIYQYSDYHHEFEPTTATDIATICPNDAANRYRGSDLCIYLDTDTPPHVTKLAARGNLLNWLASSKLDVEKKILTGGKYDAYSHRLIMESRGCVGRPFVKKVAVNNSIGLNYATFGVRSQTGGYTTMIDVYDVTPTGFQQGLCQTVIDQLLTALDEGILGQIKASIEECMNYNPTGNDPLQAYKAAFNHSVQECWYHDKFGHWQPGDGTVNSITNDCQNVYGLLREAAGYTWPGPASITTDHTAYVCSGNYTSGAGYVGRCWDHSAAIYDKNSKWAVEGWSTNATEETACVESAMHDFCQGLKVTEVPDPSDVASTTTDYWNIPAMLIDAGLSGQMGDPIKTLYGYVERDTAPTGIVQDKATSLRLGVMVFNNYGSASECNTTESQNISFYCDSPVDEDGGVIVQPIQPYDASNVGTLVNSINAIQATTWTPFAEAFYDAIGYFTQDSSMRLNTTDFGIGSGYNPVQAWCQKNNILIISDGASTTDLNSSMAGFASAHGDNDTDAASCAGLQGSTYLDDLTYYAKHELHTDFPDVDNISTYVVYRGSSAGNFTGECDPYSLLNAAATNGGTDLYLAESMTGLETALKEAFDTISAQTASASAASVISASRGGEGAVYQAIFWPKLGDNSTYEAQWLGDVHALFVDAQGRMYEDSDGNQALDPGPAGDKQITIYYDTSVDRSRACLDGTVLGGACNGTVEELQNVHYLWSAASWLNSITTANIGANRAPYISSSEKRRYIFTWDDLNDNGIVDSDEILQFEANTNWAGLSVNATRAPVPVDFGVALSDNATDAEKTAADTAVDAIVNWVRGLDQTGMRSRKINATTTWRLGDVIYSTPMTVATPAENYDQLYNDSSYRAFARQYRYRRHMIYFGGNDGMLHAVNGGFYDSATKGFCRGMDANGTCSDSGPDIGEEMWAYVPYNLLPHLKCMTDPDYKHAYFVDLRPRIFDVQIFPADGTHPNGWGTILVGGMRFGGGPVAMNQLDLDGNGIPDHPTDDRLLTSAYFILDITNPSVEPTLLGELTRTTSASEADLGYTTVISTMTPFKQGNSSTWYLILGSGPTELDGTSTQNGLICTLPLNWLVDGSKRALRLPDALPDANQGGCFTLPEANSFVSNPVTADFDLNRDYKADAVYFGSVSGSAGSFSGKIYRLVTRQLDANGTQMNTPPNTWASLVNGGATTNPTILLDAQKPITAAPALGWDGDHYWVYVGTGRFFDATVDKSDNSTQYYYGVMEPSDNATGEPTWATVAINGTGATPGSRGLLRVDQIEVNANSPASAATLACDANATCLPSGVVTYDQLITYVTTQKDGWYREFTLDGERNLGQAALLGGLLIFTSYQPFLDPCLSDGYSYLYGLYYQTGTAWHEQVFGGSIGQTGYVQYQSGPYHGLAATPNLHMGQQDGLTSFVQTSTGEILEINIPELPEKQETRSGRISWHEIYTK